MSKGNKRYRIFFWISTGLLSAMMILSASMYFFNNEVIKANFITLGFPTYLIYPLATAKLLGVVAIVSRKSATLKEWAYAGFFFNFVLAFLAHWKINDGEHFGALIAIVLLLLSYFFGKKAF